MDDSENESFERNALELFIYLMVCVNINIDQKSNILLIYKGLYSTHCITFD